MALQWTAGFEQYPSDTDYGFVSDSALRDIKSLVDVRYRLEHSILQSTNYDFTSTHIAGGCAIVGFTTESAKVPIVYGGLQYAMDSGTLYFDGGPADKLYPLKSTSHSAYQANMLLNLAHYSGSDGTAPLYIPTVPASTHEATVYSINIPWITGLAVTAASYWQSGAWADTAIVPYGLHGGTSNPAAVTGMGIGGIQHDDNVISHGNIVTMGLLEPQDLGWVLYTGAALTLPAAVTTVTLSLPRRSMTPSFVINSASTYCYHSIYAHYVATFTGVNIDYIPIFDIVGGAGEAQVLTPYCFYLGT